ncbi:MAG: CapA family protein [Bacilli bacterium]|nr:CapA family protein [Bacilli bacterium]
MAKKKKRRVRLSFTGKLLVFLIILAAILVGYNTLSYKFNSNGNSNSIIKSKSSKSVIKEEKEKVYTLKLLGTGDGLVHSNVFKAFHKNGVYDFTPAVSLIKQYIKENKYDLAYYNQETVFGGEEIGYSGYPLFNTPSEYGDAMIDAGFNMVSLATNHSLDRGLKGGLNSVAYWKEKKDVLSNGMADSEEMRNDFIIKEKNNIKYTMLSYTVSTNGINVPSGSSYILNVYDKEQVKKDIEAVRDKVDVLIVAMHWGVEYTNAEIAEQREMAKYLASLNVDIVLGNHPHVIEPYEKIDNTHVFYSHGNFLSNQPDENTKIGLLSGMTITKTVKGNESKVEIGDITSELIYTYSYDVTGANATYLVVPFSYMHDEKYLKNYKTVFEKYKKIMQKYDENLNVIDAG